MLDKLEKIGNRYEELCAKSEQPDFYADPKKAAALLREKNASGKLGVKSGEGFYDYSGGRGAKAVEERNRKLTALCGILFS